MAQDTFAAQCDTFCVVDVGMIERHGVATVIEHLQGAIHQEIAAIARDDCEAAVELVNDYGGADGLQKAATLAQIVDGLEGRRKP